MDKITNEVKNVGKGYLMDQYSYAPLSTPSFLLTSRTISRVYHINLYVSKLKLSEWRLIAVNGTVK